MTIKNTSEEIHWVYQSIILWSEISKNKDLLKKIFSTEEDTFYFLHGKVATDNIHAYLGFFDQKIYLHYIPSSIDQEKNFEDPSKIPNQLSSCVATYNIVNLGSPIKKEDALKRIEDWKNTDLRNTAIDTNEPYQLFLIPNDDFKGNLPLKINFGLIENRPDLVIQQLGKTDSFFDTCRPVPPFPPQTQDNFGLLNVIEKLKK